MKTKQETRDILEALGVNVKIVDGFLDLSGANLSGANLGKAVLYRANLSGADLRGADLRDANLGSANLRGAKLFKAVLYRANLSGADLRGADLCKANLSEANLSGADLRDAILYGANLSGAHLSDIKNKVIITFTAGRHFAYYVGGYIKIGCIYRPVGDWLLMYREMGEVHKYTDQEVKLYGNWIKMINNEIVGRLTNED